MEEVGRILPSVFGRHMCHGDSHLVSILAPLWARAVGEGIAQNCRPVSFVSGTLTLATGCSTWMTQLRQISEEVRAGINSFLGRPVVKRLRVRYVPKLALDEGWSQPEVRDRQPERPPLAGRHSKPNLDLSNLDPEIARTIERSFIKYFSRAAVRDLEN